MRHSSEHESQQMYLYQDGHAVVFWSKRDPHVGKVEWCEVHEKPFPKLKCNFTGRLIFRSAFAYQQLLKNAVSIAAQEPSIAGGSENTKAKGVEIGGVTIGYGKDEWRDNVHIPMVVGLGGDVTYQADCAETFLDAIKGDTWSDTHIAQIHRVKVAPVEKPVE